MIVISVPNAADDRWSTFEKLMRILGAGSASTSVEISSPIIWMFASSRMLRSMNST